MDDTDHGAVARLRATAHPVRLRILSLLTAEAMSAAEVARALDLTHANASYHLRQLHDAGGLVVESEEKYHAKLRLRRGANDAAQVIGPPRPAQSPPQRHAAPSGRPHPRDRRSSGRRWWWR